MTISKQEAELLTVVIDSCACTTLRKASRVVTSFFDQAFEPTGLKSTQLSVLLAAALYGPTTIRSLADATVMDPSSLSRALPRLENMGYIKKSVGESKRSRMVEVTNEGMDIIRQAAPLWEKAQVVFRSHVGQDNVSTLLGMLQNTLSLNGLETAAGKPASNGSGKFARAAGSSGNSAFK